MNVSDKMYYSMDYDYDLTDNHFVTCAIIVTVIQFILFVIVAISRCDQLTDFGSGLSFALVALVTFSLGQRGRVIFCYLQGDCVTVAKTS